MYARNGGDDQTCLIQRSATSLSIRMPFEAFQSGWRDVRALGLWAPLRAMYEISKWTGGHRLVFRTAPRNRAAPRFESPSLTACPGFDGPRRRCLAEADEIARGRVRIFGQVVNVGEDPDWHSTVTGPRRWGVLPWWRVDIRSPSKPGDVKWAWELGRHRHLVVLARAAALEPHESRWITQLQRQLTSWLCANPPERGVHWYSSLELALRSISWLQIIDLVGDQLDVELSRKLVQILHHTGRHILRELPYTISSMRNNHLLGDSLGLIALGRSFPDDDTARRWERVGSYLFHWQLRRQIRSDGSMIEDSLSYHRFVLEMLAIRIILGGATDDERRSLIFGARHLARLGVLDGIVPCYGDWDEGRVLTSSGDASSLAGIVRLALALSGEGGPNSWHEAYDEVAWFARIGDPSPCDSAESAGNDVGGGIARAELGDFRSWLKAGGGYSHSHADRCSTTLAFGKTWIVGDPGTGAYNGPEEERDYFRCSVAHSVLRIGGQDQLVPYRSFRWTYSANGLVGTPALLLGGRLVVMWGIHDAYRRLSPPRRVVRVAALSEQGLLVCDWVEGPPGAEFLLSVPLGPDILWSEGELRLPNGREFVLDLPGTPSFACGDRAPYRGWWSPTYASFVPSTLLTVAGTIEGPVWWAVRSPTSRAPELEGETLGLGEVRLTVTWGSLGPQLRVREGRQLERVLAMGAQTE